MGDFLDFLAYLICVGYLGWAGVAAGRAITRHTDEQEQQQ